MPNYYIGNLQVSQVFFRKKCKKFPYLQREMGLSPGNTALVRFYVHQNDVRTDPADAIPGDNKVVPATPKTEMHAGFEQLFHRDYGHLSFPPKIFWFLPPAFLPTDR